MCRPHPLCYTTAPSAGARQREAAYTPGSGAAHRRHAYACPALTDTRYAIGGFFHAQRPAHPTELHGLLIGMLGVLACLGHAAETFIPARVAVYFSPNGSATDGVVREVRAAKIQILVQV